LSGVQRGAIDECKQSGLAGVAAGCRNDHREGRPRMLYWAAIFFIIAIIAAAFGFGGIAAGAAGIAKVLFFIFLVLFVLSLLGGIFRGGPRTL
jgi:uncharacterized membrane protein YtjA (UPF0391 family)